MRCLEKILKENEQKTNIMQAAKKASLTRHYCGYSFQSGQNATLKSSIKTDAAILLQSKLILNRAAFSGIKVKPFPLAYFFLRRPAK